MPSSDGEYFSGSYHVENQSQSRSFYDCSCLQWYDHYPLNFPSNMNLEYARHVLGTEAPGRNLNCPNCSKALREFNGSVHLRGGIKGHCSYELHYKGTFGWSDFTIWCVRYDFVSAL